jgi:hypothetical protein
MLGHATSDIKHSNMTKATIMAAQSVTLSVGVKVLLRQSECKLGRILHFCLLHRCFAEGLW